MADLCDLAFALRWEELQGQLAALTQACAAAGTDLPDYEAAYDSFAEDLAALPVAGTVVDSEQLALRRALGVA